MNSRFPPAVRLRERADYNLVFSAPEHRSSDRYFTVLGRFNVLNTARLGLVVKKKDIKRAHERNRIKRLAREYFRCHREALPHLDLVIIAKTPASLVDNEMVRQSLHWHQKKMSRLVNHDCHAKNSD